MPEKKTAADTTSEYIVRNRMTHWQKTYPHWVSVASIIILLLFWEAICRCGLVSSGTEPDYQRPAYHAC